MQTISNFFRILLELALFFTEIRALIEGNTRWRQYLAVSDHFVEQL